MRWSLGGHGCGFCCCQAAATRVAPNWTYWLVGRVSSGVGMCWCACSRNRTAAGTSSGADCATNPQILTSPFPLFEDDAGGPRHARWNEDAEHSDHEANHSGAEACKDEQERCERYCCPGKRNVVVSLHDGTLLQRSGSIRCEYRGAISNRERRRTQGAGEYQEARAACCCRQRHHIEDPRSRSIGERSRSSSRFRCGSRRRCSRNDISWDMS